MRGRRVVAASSGLKHKGRTMRPFSAFGGQIIAASVQLAERRSVAAMARAGKWRTAWQAVGSFLSQSKLPLGAGS
jgi:hypothetical protein